MSGYYPQYPGEDPGPVAPPAVQHPPPPAHVPPPQNTQPPHWRPPAPPEPRRPPEGSTHRPGTVTAAVWTMLAGALVTVVSTVVSVFLVGHLREIIERDLALDPTVDAAFVDGFSRFFSAAMVAFIVASALVTVAVWIWMAWKNGQGRPWARITATCLGGLSIVGMVGSGGINAIDYAMSDLPLPSTGLLIALGIVTVANLVVSAVALVLLWLKPSNAYFTAVADQRRWMQWSRLYGYHRTGQ